MIVVVISVAKCSDCHYVLPQISLPHSDSHYSFLHIYIAKHFEVRVHTHPLVLQIVQKSLAEFLHL